MHKLLPSLLLLGLLSGCITVETRTPPPPLFVTSTLPAGPVATSTLTPTPADVPSRPEDCTDDAVLLQDVTIPDGTVVKGGETFVKTWRLKNMGTCPWDANYRLVSLAGEKMSAPDSVALTVTLPGESADVSVQLVAPSANGSYTGVFALRNPLDQTVMIGTSDNVWVKIIVGSGGGYVPPVATSPFGGATSVPPIANCNATTNAGYVSQLLDLMNAARREVQAVALTVHPQLTAAAQGHSMDMACNNFLSHTGSNGSYIHERLRAAGYMNAGFNEIIAIGTPQDAMYQWKNDPGHWEIVINPNITAIGIGYAYSATSDYGGYFTVDLGTP